MRWAVIILIVLGILAAISASLLVNTLRTEKKETLTGKGQVKVVVAARSLPAMSWITSQNIEMKAVQKKGLAADYFSDPTQVVGKVLAVPIVKDQVLTKSSLITEGSGEQLAATLPAGMRAVSVPVSKHSVMGGLLYPGCLVDVIATFNLRSSDAKGEAISTTLLNGVRVLAIQDESIISRVDSQEQKPKVERNETQLTVTLMVDSRQAEALQLAMNNGKIALAMKNPLDQQEVGSDAMVLSQGRLAKLGQLLGTSVRSAGGRTADFDANGVRISGDPNLPVVDRMKEAERLESLFGNGSGDGRRSPQWEITVIRGKEVKEEILEMTESGYVSKNQPK
jgi:pilus assembly protein CpaB